MSTHQKESVGEAGNGGTVKAVSLRLPDDLAAALDDESERLGVGRSELIRQGIVMRLMFAMAIAAAQEGEDVDSLLAEALRQIARRRRRER